MEVKNLKHLVKQILSFLLISGIGWIIDFGVFYLASTIIGIAVVYANILSSIPAITYVFNKSTRKIFDVKNDNCRIHTKYLIYLIYQLFLVVIVSCVAQYIYNYFLTINILKNSTIVYNHLKLISKIIITPITMTCNFIVMKILSEKI